MLQIITDINTAVNNLVWGIPAMVCIIGVGLYLSLRTRFIQFRKFGHTFRVTIGKIFAKSGAAEGAVTPFQAVCTALAATVGTGNIAGVAGACPWAWRYCHRRSGSGVLDVGFCIAWYVYEVFRGYSGRAFQGEESARRLGRRSDVLY